MNEQKPITETDVREALVKRLLKDREILIDALKVIELQCRNTVHEVEAWTTRKNDGL
jgi:hypothetical protein